tara:strand:- start:652 stop:996 length:345 start_codon:yes stop_codon:yes gene_type:complete
MNKETYYGVPEYSDTVTVSLGDITVDTIDLSDTITINSGSIATSIITDGTGPHWADSIHWDPIEFEDQMPTVAKVEDMCNDYPALDKAYENFKTIYKLVEQDWIGRQKKDDPLF